jgi:hypothetical protein
MRLGNKPYISVVMVDGSFRESFHSLDFFGEQTISPKDYEVIWVEYYDSVKPVVNDKIGKFGNFHIVTLNRKGTYHSSYCFNAGICESKGEIIVIPDADVVVDRDFLERVLQEHQTNDNLVMYIYRCNEPKEKHMTEIDIEHLRHVGELTNPSNYGGCLTVRKKWLLEINGYELHPIFGTGDHANGLDIYTRLKALGLHVMWHPQLRLYHPWHPGTLVTALSSRLQHVVINYRAVNLMTTPFQGIDSRRDSELPCDLLKRLEERKSEYASKSRFLLKKLRSLLRGCSREIFCR